ncbi:glycoside hydrolase family 2 protein [Mucilaginibacter paludis]|uniref:Glycoside hydrolase family 2 sugar binding n=1 Tax=Mucilaginibacter paludis DSM 18603 TaxID=714943 RepID=H1Y8B8_9SPHI|nr:glycoside hydrolase family 2 TIM barrel-domain containing protein [Mucilaginibacter paludis]EHQ24937.1 glycoside hydrolase family 2 sugar binding [Mucilaginibacter paludis DSM 18603]
MTKHISLKKQFLLTPILFFIFFSAFKVFGQAKYELNSGWVCKKKGDLKADGPQISKTDFSLQSWMQATVPGTVLTTLLNNKKVPDPFWGMNNNLIKDIYYTGSDYYTYWFVKDFEQALPAADGQVYLNLRGVNYSCEVYLNGKKLNDKTHYGMFLRQAYNITPLLNKGGKNRLAVLVYPPDPAGEPNGGQGGDGRIAKNVGLQYTAGWDWIQPIRDRNTGIWDKVTIETTGAVQVSNPHVITLVPGLRQVNGKQQPASIKVSAQLTNPTSKAVSGVLQYLIGNDKVVKNVLLKPHTTVEVKLSDFTLKDPKLWWPNGYGTPYLYKTNIQFLIGDKVSDQQSINVGVRELQTSWNGQTKSLEVAINGQKIFIKGGNWIISDAMLRFTNQRYDSEVRFHRDMNLNLIRIWGGALVERPEFYDACDKYGMLVFQDFWMSGDANGRWDDPMKKEDQWTRRKYPDDHQLYLASAADQIKLVRNHPSLAIWCGGNEITPPEDILLALRDTLLPKLDGTRWFAEYSNSDKMSLNTIGGNGDGPYTIQPDSSFWRTHTYPFNSEVGSVGLSDYESLKRFIPKENLIAPQFSAANNTTKTDSVWDYHKYIGYDASVDAYGKPTDTKDFADKAQLVNYNQYRALIEGFSAHMWDWYTGVMIWKTQNPWTAMRGQMYDYYLDPNACLYGLKQGGEPLHVMYNPLDGMVTIVNNSFETKRDMMLIVTTLDMNGKEKNVVKVFEEILPSTVKGYAAIKNKINIAAKADGIFLSLRLLNLHQDILSDNLYWLPNAKGIYSGLQKMPPSKLNLSAHLVSAGKVQVVLSNPADAPVAFFNRLSLVKAESNERLLPVFYSDNYVSVLPGEQKTIMIDYDAATFTKLPLLAVSGWNLEAKTIKIN